MTLMIPAQLGLVQVRDVTITKQELIDFECEVKAEYEAGHIHAPIHLSKNNEEQLIELFKYVHVDDWVFSTWRSHYHALLHGIQRSRLLELIMAGKSMSIYSVKPKFLSSSIVGGTTPIALGAAMAFKRNGSPRRVWCFVGDMTIETGVFHEAHKFAVNHGLALQFVLEDNGLSTNTPTRESWNGKSVCPPDVISYSYERGYPHHGTGTWVLF